MKNRLSFKKHKKPTGLAGIGAGFFTDVRINGKKCGLISGNHSHDRLAVTIQLSVKKENGWDWKMFRYNTIVNEEIGRAWVMANIDEFISKNNMHYFEKEN